MGIDIAGAPKQYHGYQAKCVELLRAKLTLVEKMNTDNARMRGEYLKEKQVAELKVGAMQEIVDAAKDYFQKHYIEGGYVGSNIPTVERLAKALEAYTAKQKGQSCCQPHTPGMSCSCGCHR